MTLEEIAQIVNQEEWGVIQQLSLMVAIMAAGHSASMTASDIPALVACAKEILKHCAEDK